MEEEKEILNSDEDAPDAEGPVEEEAAGEAAEDLEGDEPADEAGERINELNDKYLRLYAEFDNYKKRVQKEKEDLARYANESLLYELLTSLDNLDTALEHASAEASDGLREGVEMTRRELLRTLDKFGLKPIDALEMPFDPEFHHAMSQVERDDVDEGTVLEEFRKGYMYGDRVLRASMVAVSKKPARKEAASNNSDTEEER